MSRDSSSVTSHGPPDVASWMPFSELLASVNSGVTSSTEAGSRVSPAGSLKVIRTVVAIEDGIGVPPATVTVTGTTVGVVAASTDHEPAMNVALTVPVAAKAPAIQ